MKLSLRRSTWVLMALFMLTLVTYLSMPPEVTPASPADPTSVSNDPTTPGPRPTFDRTPAPGRPSTTPSGRDTSTSSSGTGTDTGTATSSSTSTSTAPPTDTPSQTGTPGTSPTDVPTTQAQPPPAGSPAPAAAGPVPATPQP